MKDIFIFAGASILLFSFVIMSPLQIGKGNGKSPILDKDYRQNFGIKSITEIGFLENKEDYHVKGSHQKVSIGNSKGIIKAKFVYNKEGDLEENHEYSKKGVRVTQVNNFYDNEKRRIKQNENTSSGGGKEKRIFYNKKDLVDSIAYYQLDELNDAVLIGYTLTQYDDTNRKVNEKVMARNEKNGQLETTIITDYTYSEKLILKDIFYQKFKNKRSEELLINKMGYITRINSYFECVDFEYNKDGLLIRETDCTSSDPLEQQVITYHYDEKNLLVEKEIFNPKQNKSEKYIYSYTFYK